MDSRGGNGDGGDGDGEEEEEDDDDDDDDAGSLKKILRKLLSAIGDGSGLKTQQRKSKARGRKSKKNPEVLDTKRNEDQDMRLTYLELVRVIFKETFNVDGDDGFVLHETALPELVLAHQEGMANDEPNKDDLHFDMTAGPDSEWNAAVIQILLEKLQDACEGVDGLDSRSDAYLVDILKDKYARVRAVYLKGTPRMKESGKNETAREVAGRVKRDKDSANKKARTRERRINKYTNRLETASLIAEIKKHDNADDAGNWRWLKMMIEHLGRDGMSSDESEIEGDTEAAFYPRALPWRREMESELQLLDSEYLKRARARTKRGAKHIQRKRGIRKLVSKRDPAGGLPLCLYDDDWLVSQTKRAVHSLAPTTEFKWRDLNIINMKV
ncbi:hypothetical protein BD410DRAFT_847262 [Rickenella mellea]|uniref:Uncharacterized protein n=1 Tax=Rickenella mellea TaxID=50990 RepID=A0A4Y7PD43_9AGAM|nr:hypothetical protein BD410DRAFT_847262 [Rickenella mellea]